MSAFSSTLFTSDILSFNLVQTRLEENFLKIAEQMDRLGIMNDQLEARFNQKIDQIEDRLENELGNSTNVRLRPSRLQNAPIGELQTVKQDESLNLNTSKNSNHMRISTKEAVGFVGDRGDPELAKQINNLLLMIDQQRSRIDELQQAVYISPRPVIVSPRSPNTKKVISPNKGSKTAVVQSNTPKKTNQNRYDQELNRLQLQISSLQKQMKQLNSKKDKETQKPLSSKKQIPKEQQVPDQIQEVKKETEEELTFGAIKQIIDEINFKINRIDNESTKIYKQIGTLATDRDKHEEELLAIVQKIKKNETSFATDMKDLTTKLETIGVKRVVRHCRNSVLNSATQSGLAPSARSNFEVEDLETKRFEGILEQIEDLKDEVTGIIKQKQEQKRQCQIQKNPNAPPPVQTTIVQKANVQSLQLAMGSLKKEVNSLRLELEHMKNRQEISQLMNQTMNQTSTENKPYFLNKSIDGKDQWKEWALKLQKVRSELLSYIKDLDVKISEKEDTVEQLRQVEALVNENRILVNKKADRSDVQKILKRLETRLNNFIKQSIAQQQLASTHDARIARQPWFCLSCDTQLKNFSGKQGKYLSRDLLPVKKLNTQNHMVRRSIKEMEPIK